MPADQSVLWTGNIINKHFYWFHIQYYTGHNFQDTSFGIFNFLNQKISGYGFGIGRLLEPIPVFVDDESFKTQAPNFICSPKISSMGIYANFTAWLMHEKIPCSRERKCVYIFCLDCRILPWFCHIVRDLRKSAIFFVDITPRPVAVHIFRFIAYLFISKRTQQIQMIKKGRIQTEKMKREKCHQILTNWTKMFSQIKLRKNAGHGNRFTLFSIYNRLIRRLRCGRALPVIWESVLLK